MASTYTLNQGIEKPGTGEQSGTWGSTTNTNFDIIDRALSGVGSVSLTGTSHTLTTTDGSLTDGMYKVLVLGGSPSGTNTITLSDNTQDKVYFVVNSSGQEVQFSQGTGANATIANGYSDIIYADGAGSGAAVASLFATGLKIGTDLKVGDDLFMLSDSSVIHFGADSDVTVTHDPDDGLVLKSTATADDNPFLLTLQTGETDLAANDVIGKIAFQAPDEGTGTDAILVSAAIQARSEGDFAADANATSIDFMTGASEAATSKMSLTSGGDLNILTDGASIFFGADSEIELRHVADDGLILKHVGTGDGKEPSLTFQAGDNDIAADDVLGGIYFQAPDETTGTDAITVAARIEAVAETDFSSSVNKTSLVFKTADSGVADFSMAKLTSGGDWHLLNDGPSIFFGTNSDIELRHVHNDGLILKNTNTGDGAAPSFTFQAGDTDIAVDDVLGAINFQAPDEATGTDAQLVAAGISAISEGDFSSSANNTSLVFKTGYSEAASEKMRIMSGGAVAVGIQALGDTHNLASIGASNDEGIVVRGSNGGCIQVAGSSNSDNDFLGQIGFVNLANADAGATDADGQTKAFIRGLTRTSDSNAGDDSGTSIQFAAAIEANGIGEVCRIHGGSDYSATSLVVATDDFTLTGAEHTSTADTVGVALTGNSVFSANAIAIKAQRVGNNSNGDVIQIMRGTGSVQGTISVSGSTVSYNAFTGSHWSRLTDNSKPAILQGTIMETLDEMCDWYRAKWSVKYTADDVTNDVYKMSDIIPSGKKLGDRKGTFKEGDIRKSHVEYISLPDGKKDGDTFTHNSEMYGTVTATIEKEEDFKHVKCKISDTAECTNVYGVFQSWDNDDDCVNDMYVNALGSAEVRVHKDQTVAKGDLLTSNGDGTAKKQDDDIIRTKTIGKVLTNIKQNTYEDGSYTVPCSLYCG